MRFRASDLRPHGSEPGRTLQEASWANGGSPTRAPLGTVIGKRSGRRAGRSRSIIASVFASGARTTARALRRARLRCSRMPRRNTWSGARPTRRATRRTRIGWIVSRGALRARPSPRSPEAVERFKQTLVEDAHQGDRQPPPRAFGTYSNRAIRRGVFGGRNPVSVVGLFREENTRTRWLTAEEEAKLFAVIPEPYRAFCKVALYTRARRGKLLDARWDQVDARRGLLTLPTSTSGRPRHIELSSLVLSALERIPRHLGTPRIFPDCRKVTHSRGWLVESGWSGRALSRVAPRVAPAETTENERAVASAG